ncbi:MAG: phage head morphogenesis protein [Rikenellaceae bacterium]|jgi:SPP1 gp7 family putative phage head morphogenesis protein|nr:phage head morphogenesis protein [Rikenellaceae bacterium]
MRSRIRAALADNIERGDGAQSFAEVVNGEFDKAGLTRLKPYQIGVIYDTNTANAYAAGQMAKMMEVSGDFPFWQYSATMDGKTRPEHAALHGKIFKVGDFTFYPPLDFRCRCTAILLTARQAGRYPETDRPAADERQRLLERAGKHEFAGNKQKDYVAWLKSEYRDAEPSVQELIDHAFDTMRAEIDSLRHGEVVEIEPLEVPKPEPKRKKKARKISGQE